MLQRVTNQSFTNSVGKRALHKSVCNSTQWKSYVDAAKLVECYQVIALHVTELTRKSPIGVYRDSEL